MGDSVPPAPPWGHPHYPFESEVKILPSLRSGPPAVRIRGEKGTFDFRGWTASRPDDQFEIAAITVAELCHGVERASGPRKTRRRQYLKTILDSLPIIPYTEQTAYEHARICAALESSGGLIDYYDIIVAATAMERASGVTTFNLRHFTQVKGLTVIEPK